MKRILSRTWVLVVLAGAGLSNADDVSSLQREILSDVMRMSPSPLASRVAGYPGSEEAYRYLREQFEKIGLKNIFVQEFEVVVPVDEGSVFRVKEKGGKDSAALELKVYPLWPNGARLPSTPPDGLSGAIVYCGGGTFEEMNGKEIEGAICIMDVSSGANWLNAAMLGAKAVVFTGPAWQWSRTEAAAKFTNVSLSVGRYWLPWEEGESLLQKLKAGSLQGTIVSRMKWERRTARNIVGVLPGTGKVGGGRKHVGGEKGAKEECLVVSAYYDAMSVVPSVAPGAEQAASIAALLSLARHLSKNPPKRTVIFVATDAHFLFYRGIRELMAAVGKDEGVETYLADSRQEAERKIHDYGEFLKILSMKDPAALVEEVKKRQHVELRDIVTSYVQGEMSRRAMEAGNIAMMLEKNPPGKSVLEKRRNSLVAERMRYVDILKLFSQFASDDAWDRLPPASKDLFRHVVSEISRILEERRRDLSSWLSRLETARKLRDFFAGYDVRLFLSLDISGGEDRFGLFPKGGCFSESDESIEIMFNTLADKIRDDLLSGESDAPFVNIPHQTAGWSVFIPPGAGFESEFSLVGGFRSLAAATVQDMRLVYDTPVDTVDRFVSSGNLKRVAGQVRFLNKLVSFMADWDELLKEKAAQTLPRGIRMGLIDALFISRSVASTSSAGTPVAGALVRMRMAMPGNPTRKAMGGVRGAEFRFSDSFGDVRFLGLRRGCNYVMDAYLLDEDTGEIVGAADRGVIGGKFPQTVQLGRFHHHSTTVVFGCRATEMYFLMDARSLAPISAVDIIDARTEGLPREYGYDCGPGTSLEEPLLVVYMPSGQSFKAIMRSGVLGVRMLLLNATEKNPVGGGYPIDKPRVLLTPLRAAMDMDVLSSHRIREQRRHQITNERVDRLKKEAETVLGEAREALQKKNYVAFMDRVVRALALEVSVYNDVVSTSNDTLKGVVFYMLALLPFAFFFERLVFAATRIQTRLALFFLVFIGMFLILYFVHPAFALTKTPGIVPVAIIMLSLALIVTGIVYSRFSAQMRQMEEERRGIRSPDVGRGTAAFAGFMLGISNMRRRKVRTWLTSITVVLVTFTLLSFVSITPELVARKFALDTSAPYTGMFLRAVGWLDIHPFTTSVLRWSFPDGEVASRVWVMPVERGEVGRIFVSLGGNRTFARAFLGLSPQEAKVTGVGKALLDGEWFKGESGKVCILPSPMASSLGVKVGDRVRAYGLSLKVIGVFDPARFDAVTDMNGERITPVAFTVSAAARERAAQQRNVTEIVKQDFVEGEYNHISSENVVLVPAGLAIDLGGKLKSVSVALRGKESEVSDRLDAFTRQVSTTVYAGIGGKSYLVSSKAAMSIGGGGSIFIPLAIGGLIILSTMLGAVHERRTEIGTYSAVGLAPSHVATLFVAESVVYAVVGAMVGYLLGQSVVALLRHAGFVFDYLGWHNPLGGLSQNYSSMSVVGVLLAVMGVVSLSAVYPSYLASKLCTPDVDRRWDIPSAKGDELVASFPFTYNPVMAPGVMMFLFEFMESFGDATIGTFSVSDLAFRKARSEDGKEGYVVEGRFWLAPFDLGISQHARIFCMPTEEEGVYGISVWMKRISGYEESWKRMNRRFLDTVRKQFLVWHTVADEDKKRYVEKAREILRDA